MKTLTLLAFACLILVSALTNSVNAALGIHEGDRFSYSVTCSWYSNETGVQPPSDIQKYLNAESQDYVIDMISGNYIHINVTTFFKDGTNETSTISGEYCGGNFIPSNLDAGDFLPSPPFPNWMIDETIPHTYADTTRLTNHVNVTYTIFPEFPNENINLYWDRTTGAKVEQTDYYFRRNGDYVTQYYMSMEIIDTNLGGSRVSFTNHSATIHDSNTTSSHSLQKKTSTSE